MLRTVRRIPRFLTVEWRPARPELVPCRRGLATTRPQRRRTQQPSSPPPKVSRCRDPLTPESARVGGAILPETYENALYLLSLLPTNNQAKDSFLPDAATGAKEASGVQPDSHRLNQIGIDEVLELKRRAELADLDPGRDRMRYIHVAGTKGKGSVANYITAILTSPAGAAAGKIGTYTSPHINTVRERIKIDGDLVSPDLFARCFFDLWRTLRAAEPSLPCAPRPCPLSAETETAAARQMPFFFRFVSLLAMRIFLDQGVQTAVVECGIGAEYDTTNVLLAPSDVTVGVVTALDLEHTAMLGGSLPEIAWHKAGVFKPAASAVVVRPPVSSATLDFTHAMVHAAQRIPRARTGHRPQATAEDREARQPGEQPGDAVLAVLWGKALERAVERLVEVPFDVGFRDTSSQDGVVVDGGGPVERLNMTVASVAAAEHLRQLQRRRDGSTPTAAAPPRPGLANFVPGPRTSRGRWRDLVDPRHLAALAAAPKLPGRREVYTPPHDPAATLYLDGAHTADSLRAVGEWFRQQVATAAAATPAVACIIFDQRSRDRDPASLLRALLAPLRADPRHALWNPRVLAFVGLVRPPGPDADRLRARLAADAPPWLRFHLFPDPDAAVAAAPALARCHAAAAAAAADNDHDHDHDHLDRCHAHVLVTGSFSLVSRPGERDPPPRPHLA